jgi:uncharacterized surface protein with fasciclin (FAS1) repeats
MNFSPTEETYCLLNILFSNMKLRCLSSTGLGAIMKNFISATRFMLGLALLQVNPVLAGDIVATADDAKTFKVFVSALKKSGLSETLKNSGPYTVFAPSDEAFAKLPKGEWEAITKDKAKLNQVIAYHVIPEKVLVSEVKPGKVKTNQGEALTLTSDNGKVTVNGANVTQSDITADNGVIHAIDMVILPSGQQSQGSSGQGQQSSGK